MYFVKIASQIICIYTKLNVQKECAIQINHMIILRKYARMAHLQTGIKRMSIRQRVQIFIYEFDTSYKDSKSPLQLLQVVL